MRQPIVILTKKTPHILICEMSFRIFSLRLFSVISQLKLVQHIENQAQKHTHDAGKHHTSELNFSNTLGDSGKPCDKNHRSQRQISGTAVIYLSIYQNTDTRSTNHTIQQEGNSTNNRSRNGVD